MSETEMIKIMIVDDHDMVRTGLRTYLMLEPKFEVIAEASNGQAAIDRAGRKYGREASRNYSNGFDDARNGRD